jgi:hypothetical protein
VEAIRGQTGKGKRGLTAVADRSEAVADALADCPPGRWVALDELFRYMRAAGHRFEVTRNAWTLYIGEAGYGSLGYDGCGAWTILQARYALCLLFEYAATLGLIDVAYVPPAGARPVTSSRPPTVSGGWIATSCWRRSSRERASPAFVSSWSRELGYAVRSGERVRRAA